MSSIVPFSFESFSVRVIRDDSGEMLFVAKDAAESLEYKDPTTAIKSHCRGVQELHPIQDALGRTQNMRVIREPDLYRLIAGSTLPSAERFERWLFEEVLPSIRKTGSYHADPATPQVDAALSALKISPLAARAARAFGFRGNMAALSADRAVRAITGASPLALFGQTAMASEDQEPLLLVTEIEKRLGWKARTVNHRLVECGMQTMRKDAKGKTHYELTEQGMAFGIYLDTGKRHGDGTPVQQVKWKASVVDLLGETYPTEGDAA